MFYCDKDYVNQYEFSIHATANEEAWILVRQWLRGDKPKTLPRLKRNFSSKG